MVGVPVPSFGLGRLPAFDVAHDLVIDASILGRTRMHPVMPHEGATAPPIDAEGAR